MTVDGKAFFGKAGRGRINIDGDNGTISSASYQQNRIPIKDANGVITGYENRSSAGMMIDLDDGFIDMHGTIQDASTQKYLGEVTHNDDTNQDA